MALTADVLVIGAGIIGCGIAYELAKAGVRIVVAERGDIGRESSWAGAGVCIAQRPGHHWLNRLRNESQRLYPQWVAELKEQTGIDAEWCPCGRLELFGDESEWQRARQVAQSLRESGVAVDVLTAEEGRQVEPAVTEQIVGALLWHDDAHVRNPRLVRALALAAMRRNAVFLTHSPVLSLRLNDYGVEAQAGNERVSAGSLVIAAGCWSNFVGAMLGVDIPVAPVRGQIVLLDAMPTLLRHIVEWGDVYLVPRRDGKVLVGATVEFVGYDKRTTAEGVAMLLRTALQVVPSLRQGNFVTAWAGLRPYAERPLIGQLAGSANTFVATGHFRIGIQLAPATAFAIRDFLLRGESDLISPSG